MTHGSTAHHVFCHTLFNDAVRLQYEWFWSWLVCCPQVCNLEVLADVRALAEDLIQSGRPIK